jgi:hypothetical protein
MRRSVCQVSSDRVLAAADVCLEKSSSLAKLSYMHPPPTSSDGPRSSSSDTLRHRPSCSSSCLRTLPSEASSCSVKMCYVVQSESSTSAPTPEMLTYTRGFHLLLLSWLSEASNNRFRKLAHDHGTTVAIHMVIVLKRAITPTDPSRDDSCGKELLALVTDAADSIVRAAFRNLSLLELGSVPNVLLLKLLETSLQIICALALKLEASAAVFTPEEVTIVSRVFSFIACRGHDLQAPHHSDIAVQRAFRDSVSCTSQRSVVPTCLGSDDANSVRELYRAARRF